MMKRGRVKLALPDEVDLVEWEVKLEKTIPAACFMSFIQHPKTSCDANLIGGMVVRKKTVLDGLETELRETLCYYICQSR